MSTILSGRVKNHINANVLQHLDLSDSQDDAHKALSRGLAAVCIRGLCNSTYSKLSQYIVDGTKDNGIDGIFYDETRNKLYLIQSKWSTKGTGTLETGDLRKFIAGTYDLLNLEFGKFNSKVNAISDQISQAISNDPHIVLVATFNSGNDISTECKEIIEEFLHENNSDSQEVVTFQVFNIDKIIRAIKNSKHDEKTDVSVNLLEWGEQKNPYYSIYGKISCADLAEIHLNYGDLLTSENIRNSLPDSEINQKIEQELKTSPTDFWYLNNGITAIAEEIKRKPIGLGEQRESGHWSISNLKIVNGAQTTGSISRAYQTAREEVKKAYVQIKIISLDNSPIDIAEKITTATNTQNRVEAKDFLALDPIQEGIAEFFNGNGIAYTYKRGAKPVTPSANSTDVTELATALAISSSDMTSVTTAKRNFGSLTDPNGYYRKLFKSGDDFSGYWTAIEQFRRAESVTTELENLLSGRDQQLVIHGNRFIQHILISSNESINIDRCKQIHSILKDNSNSLFGSDCYLAVLFKNTKKCEILRAEVVSDLKEVKAQQFLI